MKVLVFGKGWIGQQFISNTTHTVIQATTRPENIDDTFDEIKAYLVPPAVIKRCEVFSKKKIEE